MSSVQKPIFLSVTSKKVSANNAGPSVHKNWVDHIKGSCEVVSIDAETVNHDNWFTKFSILNGSVSYSSIYIYLCIHGLNENGVQYVKFNENYKMSEAEFMGMITRSLTSNIFVFFEMCHSGYFTLKNVEDIRRAKTITLFSTCSPDEKSYLVKTNSLFESYQIGICTQFLMQNNINPYLQPEKAVISFNSSSTSRQPKKQTAVLMKYTLVN